MSAVLTKTPPAAEAAGPTIHRFTVAEYHRMGELGILTKQHRVELVNGFLVEKPVVNPPHSSAVSKMNRQLVRLLGIDAVVRVQQPVSLAGSEPEPDLAFATGEYADYDARHPAAADMYIVIEVSDTSLAFDRGDKLRAYAAARIPVYWVVNLVDRVVEVYTNPRAGRNPAYRTRTDFAPGADVPVVAAGKVLGTVAVSEVFP